MPTPRQIVLEQVATDKQKTTSHLKFVPDSWSYEPSSPDEFSLQSHGIDIPRAEVRRPANSVGYWAAILAVVLFALALVLRKLASFERTGLKSPDIRL